MLVYIYKQSYENVIDKININKIDEYIKIKCQDCGGTGKFELPDNLLENCVCCKGTGLIYCNLY